MECVSGALQLALTALIGVVLLAIDDVYIYLYSTVLCMIYLDSYVHSLGS